MSEDKENAYHIYCLTFVYRQKTYSIRFESTVLLMRNDSAQIIWDIVGEYITKYLKQIHVMKKGIFPHSLEIQSESDVFKVIE
jgi:hypothetical protein